MKASYVLIVTCVLVAACGDSPGLPTGPTAMNGQPAPAGSHTLSGTIRDADGLPLAGVTLVVMVPTDGGSVVSDAAGRYSLGNLNGMITLRASKEGYFDSYQQRFIAADQVLNISLPPRVELVPGTTLRGVVGGEPCDPIGWDARARCRQIFFTPPTSGTLDLVLTWSGPSDLDLLVAGQYFDPPTKRGEIRAKVKVAGGLRHEIRINAYYSAEEFELRAEFQPTP